MKNKLFNLIFKYKTVVCLVLSFISIAGIVELLKTGLKGNNIGNFANNFIYVGLFFLIFMMAKKVLEIVNKRMFIFSFIAALLYSAALVLGSQLDYLGGIFWSVNTLIKIMLILVFMQMILVMIINYFENYEEKELFEGNKQKTTIITFLVIFSVWVIAFLALYPGVYGYDALHQGAQFMGIVPINPDHPVIHSFWLSRSESLGYSLFGNYESGLAIYSIVQLVLFAAVATKACNYVNSKTNNKLVKIGSVMLFAILPLHQVMAVSSTKDVLFAAIFTLIFIMELEMIETPNEFWKSWKAPIKYIVLLLFLFLFRHNGIYVILFNLPFIIIWSKGRRIKATVLILLPIFIFQIFQGPILTSMIGEYNNRNELREMLSVPCQQLGRVYTYNPEGIKDSERVTLHEILPEESFKYYDVNQMISDHIKGSLKSDILKKDLEKYLSMYVDIGLRNPKLYIEAFLMSTLDAWYPNKYYPDYRRYHPYIEIDMLEAKKYNPDYIVIERHSLLPTYEKLLRYNTIKPKWSRIPVVSILFESGAYFFLLLFSLLMIVYRKEYKRLGALSLIFGLWFTVLLGPVALIRYLYPLFTCAPVLFALIVNKTGVFQKSSENKKKSKFIKIYKKQTR